MSQPTHRCTFCNRDIVPDQFDDEFGPTGELSCPHCGSYGNAIELHVDEPWIRPLHRGCPKCGFDEWSSLDVYPPTYTCLRCGHSWQG